jgi:hypothetical protein
VSLLYACETQGPFERAGEDVDESVENVRDIVEDVREGVEDARDDERRR